MSESIATRLLKPAANANAESGHAISAETWCMAAAVVAIVLLVPSVILSLFDTRVINGVSVWAKPIKFEIATALHFVTVGFLLRFLSVRRRQGRFVRWSLIAGGTAAAAELFYIFLQAGRGRISHFNAETEWEAFAYSAMSIGAVAIVASSFVVGLLIARDGATADRGNGFPLGASLGLMIGSVGTLLAGLALGSAGGHWVGGELSDANGLPLFGWSSTGGDLRVPHFFATHAMQVLPLIGWLADRTLPSRATGVVWLCALVYTVFGIATYFQARAGLPFIS